MKQKKYPILWLIFFVFQNIHSSALPVASSQPTNSDIFMTAQTSDAQTLASIKNLHDTVVPYPIRGILPDGTIQQGLTNRTIKAMTPKKTEPILRSGTFSVLPAASDAFKNYPTGASIFPGYPQLATKFDAMIANFQANPRFIPFFRKVHINVLNELYHYLMSIYVNFNLQHTGIEQAYDGKISVSIPAFTKFETECDANKKTLIINHLVNVIESQFNSSIRSYVPNLPQTYASFLGKVLIQNDYSIDLTQFLEKQLEPILIANKKAYLQGLAIYLDFFQTYTSYLLQPHPKQKNHFTAFVDLAEKINQFLYADVNPNQDKQLIAVQKMNPPLFTFTYDDLRALKMIPYLAKTIAANSKKVMWPEQIVQAANQGLLLSVPGQSPHPIAYFRTVTGTVVTNESLNPEIKLYVCMKNGVNLFEEELIAQPDWLNSWDGVVNVLRACFGDFSAIVNLNILDPVMQSLVEMALQVQQGKDPNSIDTRSPACIALIDSWKNKNAQPQINASIPGLPNVATQPGLPGLGNGLPSVPNLSPALLQGMA